MLTGIDTIMIVMMMIDISVRVNLNHKEHKEQKISLCSLCLCGLKLLT